MSNFNLESQFMTEIMSADPILSSVLIIFAWKFSDNAILFLVNINHLGDFCPFICLEFSLQLLSNDLIYAFTCINEQNESASRFVQEILFS